MHSRTQVFNGTLTKYSFPSSALGDLEANLNVFLPSSASSSSPAPVLYYLSGLTCTEDNAAQKGNFFEAAAKEGIALVFPDTSPRGAKIEGEDESYDFGSGAGFYIDATKDPWSKHYKVRASSQDEQSRRCRAQDDPLLPLPTPRCTRTSCPRSPPPCKKLSSPSTSAVPPSLDTAWVVTAP